MWSSYVAFPNYSIEPLTWFPHRIRAVLAVLGPKLQCHQCQTHVNSKPSVCVRSHFSLAGLAVSKSRTSRSQHVVVRYHPMKIPCWLFRTGCEVSACERSYFVLSCLVKSVFSPTSGVSTDNRIYMQSEGASSSSALERSIFLSMLPSLPWQSSLEFGRLSWLSPWLLR